MRAASRPPVNAEATAATTFAAMAKPNATLSPSWNGVAIRCGKKLRLVRYAACPAGRWPSTVRPSTCFSGL